MNILYVLAFFAGCITVWLWRRRSASRRLHRDPLADARRQARDADCYREQLADAREHIPAVWETLKLRLVKRFTAGELSQEVTLSAHLEDLRERCVCAWQAVWPLKVVEQVCFEYELLPQIQMERIRAQRNRAREDVVRPILAAT